MALKDYLRTQYKYTEEDFKLTNPLTSLQLKWLKRVFALVLILFFSYLGYLIWLFNNPSLQTEDTPQVTNTETIK